MAGATMVVPLPSGDGDAVAAPAAAARIMPTTDTSTMERESMSYDNNSNHHHHHHDHHHHPHLRIVEPWLAHLLCQAAGEPVVTVPASSVAAAAAAATTTTTTVPTTTTATSFNNNNGNGSSDTSSRNRTRTRKMVALDVSRFAKIHIHADWMDKYVACSAITGATTATTETAAGTGTTTEASSMWNAIFWQGLPVTATTTAVIQSCWNTLQSLHVYTTWQYPIPIDFLFLQHLQPQQPQPTRAEEEEAAPYRSSTLPSSPPFFSCFDELPDIDTTEHSSCSSTSNIIDFKQHDDENEAALRTTVIDPVQDEGIHDEEDGLFFSTDSRSTLWSTMRRQTSSNASTTIASSTSSSCSAWRLRPQPQSYLAQSSSYSSLLAAPTQRISMPAFPALTSLKIAKGLILHGTDDVDMLALGLHSCSLLQEVSLMDITVDVNVDVMAAVAAPGREQQNNSTESSSTDNSKQPIPLDPILIALATLPWLESLIISIASSSSEHGVSTFLQQQQRQQRSSHLHQIRYGPLDACCFPSSGDGNMLVQPVSIAGLIQGAKQLQELSLWNMGLTVAHARAMLMLPWQLHSKVQFISIRQDADDDHDYHDNSDFHEHEDDHNNDDHLDVGIHHNLRNEFQNRNHERQHLSSHPEQSISIDSMIRRRRRYGRYDHDRSPAPPFRNQDDCCRRCHNVSLQTKAADQQQDVRRRIVDMLQYNCTLRYLHWDGITTTPKSTTTTTAAGGGDVTALDEDSAVPSSDLRKRIEFYLMLNQLGRADWTRHWNDLTMIQQHHQQQTTTLSRCLEHTTSPTNGRGSSRSSKNVNINENDMCTRSTTTTTTTTTMTTTPHQQHTIIDAWLRVWETSGLAHDPSALFVLLRANPMLSS